MQYLGDAGGHIYFWLVEHNTRPYNVGLPLLSDIVLPIVVWVSTSPHGAPPVTRCPKGAPG